MPVWHLPVILLMMLMKLMCASVCKHCIKGASGTLLVFYWAYWLMRKSQSASQKSKHQAQGFNNWAEAISPVATCMGCNQNRAHKQQPAWFKDCKQSKLILCCSSPNGKNPWQKVFIQYPTPRTSDFASLWKWKCSLSALMCILVVCPLTCSLVHLLCMI